jgi:hypothetical protein
MSIDQPAGIYLVAADSGHGPEIDEGEVYNDAAYAWTMADELQAEANADDEAVRYGVYALTAVERPGQR